MGDFSIINDTVHGSIKLDELGRELIATSEMQRLNNIKQLGLAYLVFPGANHSRFEHSLGCYHIARWMAREIGLSDEETKLVSAAGMLHDIGHGPYSHTLETIIKDRLGIDHMELTEDVITGRQNIDSQESTGVRWGTIPEILWRHGLNPDEVGNLISHDLETSNTTLDEYNKGSEHFSQGKQYLSQMIHGVVDADQIDYLLRDAHYTGVTHGGIDVERLLQTLTVHNGDLVIYRKGLTAVEGMLVARALMYSSVYFHKTNRIAQGMAQRAVERLDPDILPEIYKMVDSDFMNWLSTTGDFQRDMARRLRYRQLFKGAYSLTLAEVDDEKKDHISLILDHKDRRYAEDAIAKRVGLPEGYVMIDLPSPELQISEPRIDKTEIKVKENGSLKPLSRYSPLAKALQRRVVSRWAMVVSCPAEHTAQVNKAVEKILF